MTDSLNAMIAARLDEVALLLEHQEANPFRVAAYRQAANTLRDLPVPVSEILEEAGLEGLEKLPGIGTNLSRAIRTVAVTGSLPLLDRLRGESGPQSVLMTMPGIGPKLAEMLHDDLGIETLEDLEVAAHDGRLRKLAGFGEKRVAGIRDVLARRLGRGRRRFRAVQPPPVEELLDVDREYREKAQRGRLRRIAPRRFNPEGKAWLPVLHTRRGNCDYTALYSNTGRAHELGMTQDWVVIYCDDGSRDFTWTAVTAPRGPLKGLRVVRGREDECAAYYEAHERAERAA